MKLSFQAKATRGELVPLPHFISKVSVGLAKFKDSTVTVTVESEKRIRNLAQNRRYWGLIVPAFSEWAGYESYPEIIEKQDIRALKDSAHRTLKALFIGPRTVTRVLPNGDTITETHEPTTTELTTKEMAHLQDQAERLLNDNGIYLPADEPTPTRPPAT